MIVQKWGAMPPNGKLGFDVGFLDLFAQKLTIAKPPISSVAQASCRGEPHWMLLQPLRINGTRRSRAETGGVRLRPKRRRQSAIVPEAALPRAAGPSACGASKKGGGPTAGQRCLRIRRSP